MVFEDGVYHSSHFFSGFILLDDPHWYVFANSTELESVPMTLLKEEGIERASQAGIIHLEDGLAASTHESPVTRSVTCILAVNDHR